MTVRVDLPWLCRADMRDCRLILIHVRETPRPLWVKPHGGDRIVSESLFVLVTYAIRGSAR